MEARTDGVHHFKCMSGVLLVNMAAVLSLGFFSCWELWDMKTFNRFWSPENKRDELRSNKVCVCVCVCVLEKE